MTSSAAKVSVEENLYDTINFTSHYSKLCAACVRTTHGSVVLGGVRQDPIDAFKLHFPCSKKIFIVNVVSIMMWTCPHCKRQLISKHVVSLHIRNLWKAAGDHARCDNNALPRVPLIPAAAGVPLIPAVPAVPV